MHMMRLILLPVIFIACLCSEVESQDFLPESEPADVTEWRASADILPGTRNRIIDVISVLPEYRDTDSRIRKLTNGKHGASGIMKRDESGKGFIVRVGRGGAKFESYFIFSVDGSTFHIMVYDVLEDSFITLEALRKRSAENPSPE